VKKYCIVDLPMMLVISASQIQRMLGVEVAFHVDPRQPFPDADFVFVPAPHVDSLPAGSFDLALNFYSFMEMDREARDGYLNTIYRTVRERGIFYNVNRRQRSLPQRDGSVFDNNPLLYPYSSSDRVLAWEEDAFHDAMRTHSTRASIAFSRAAIINERET
jgi:hypothetical protein